MSHSGLPNFSSASGHEGEVRAIANGFVYFPADFVGLRIGPACLVLTRCGFEICLNFAQEPGSARKRGRPPKANAKTSVASQCGVHKRAWLKCAESCIALLKQRCGESLELPAVRLMLVHMLQLYVDEVRHVQGVPPGSQRCVSLWACVRAHHCNASHLPAHGRPIDDCVEDAFCCRHNPSARAHLNCANLTAHCEKEMLKWATSSGFFQDHHGSVKNLMPLEEGEESGGESDDETR